jgi:putative flavoprotein involved in K+ transport
LNETTCDETWPEEKKIDWRMEVDCLPPDHPLQAYLDDGRALIDLIKEDPQLLETCAELQFLRDFVGRVADDDGARGDDEGEAACVSRSETAQVDANACTGTEDEEDEEGEDEENEDYWADDSSPYEYTGETKRRTADAGDRGSRLDDDEDGDGMETYDTLIIGAGPAGLGVATSLLIGGHLRSTLLVLERHAVGSTFDAWHADTRFISPSWDLGPWGHVDLNAIEADGDPGTGPSAFYREEDEPEEGSGRSQCDGSPSILGGSQHPSGRQYARYLRSVAVRRRIPIREQCNVTSVRRIDGTAAWPSGAYEVVFDEDTEGVGDADCGTVSMTKMRKRTIYSRHVVWCGGEFGLPNTPKGQSFDGERQKAWSHYAHLGRRHEEWCALAEEAASNKVQLRGTNTSRSGSNFSSHAVIIGAYEAGVDTACSLLRRGVDHVTLVDAEDYVSGWPLSLLGGAKQTRSEVDQGPVDPSEALSPMSSSRLRHAAQSGRVTLITSARCTGVSIRRDGTFEAQIVGSATTKMLVASIPIIFCTGFEPSRCQIVQDLVKWTKDGSPIVSQECDESTVSPGFFLSGPLLRHWVPRVSTVSTIGEDFGCRSTGGGCSTDADVGEEKSSKDSSRDTVEGEGEELVEIIFCFIYKYRSRFPIVAGEILSRMVCETHTESTDHGGIIIDGVGMQRLDKVDTMLALYQERGMFANKLTCALSC